MGLCARAKGLTDETGFDCGYLTYGTFILELIKVAYGQQCHNIFKRNMLRGAPFSDAEAEYWNAHCNDDLDILIFHSDCGDKFTPQECRKIYNAMKDLKSGMMGHNYHVMKPYNMFEHWKAIFKHCADCRVNLYYS